MTTTNDHERRAIVGATFLAIGTLAIVGAFLMTFARSSSVRAQSAAPAELFVLGRVVDAGSSASIVEATVSLTPLGDPPDRERLKTLSDSQGRFVFRALRSGSYLLEVSKAGYLHGFYGQRFPFDKTSTLEVSTHAGTSPVELKLWKAGVIAGEVVDGAGEPLTTATVVALREVSRAGNRRFVPQASVRVDDRGSYRLTGLRPGSYVVAVTSTRTRSASTGLAPLTSVDHGTVYYPDARAAQLAIPQSVQSGLINNAVDFRIAPGGVSILGSLVGPDGRRGLRVQLVPSNDIASDIAGQMVTASETGAFRLDGVLPDDYVLSALDYPARAGAPLQTGAGWTSGIAPTRPPQSSYDVPTLWAAVPISVSHTDIRNVVVNLLPGASISGDVVFEGTSLRPQWFDVVVKPADGRDLGKFPVAHADQLGHFRTVGLPPGRYLLGLGIASDRWHEKSVTVRGMDMAGLPLELGGTELSEVILNVTDQPTQVRGTVQDATNKAAPDASVLAFPTQERLWKDFGDLPTRIRYIRAGSDATFSIVGLPPGDYFVAAMPPATSEVWLEAALFARLRTSAVRIHLETAARLVIPVKVSSLAPTR